MYPWCNRRPDLDEEIGSILGRSDVEVYDDCAHSCIHIIIGGTEFTSCMYPLNDSLRDDLRQQAFLLQNGLNEDEVQKIKEANERREQANQLEIEDAKADWRDEATWECKHRLFGQEVKPFIIVPGSKE